MGQALRITRLARSGAPAELVFIENRQPGVYDRTLPSYGLAVWNVLADPYAADPGRQNIRLNRAPGAMGDRGALFASPSATYHLVRFMDWTYSGVRIVNVSHSGPNMTVQIEVAPGSIIQSGP
jgi:hypothetical protein